MLKPGDKVKFLNARGGGVVTRVLDPKTVLVATEDGFEIPTLVSELLRMDPAETGGRFFEEDFMVPAGIDPETSTPTDERSKPLSGSIKSSRKKEEVLLGFIPHEQKWLITGLLDVVMVNNTSWDILYSLFLTDEKDELRGKDYGSAFADTHLLLATINREELPLWLSGEIQLLFHKDRPGGTIPPFSARFKIQGQKFYKEGNYKEVFPDMGKGIFARLFTISDLTKETPGKKIREEEDLIFRHRTAEREAVVDLHMQELVDDFSGFEKGEILEFQLNYAKECLHTAMEAHFLKVILIHGVGEGVLRERLMDMIAKAFPDLSVLDAPMDKYGVGAIEIRFSKSF